MTPLEKDIAQAWQAVTDFRKSKCSEIKVPVNFLDDEIDLNNKTIEFVDIYLLCDIAIAKAIISKLTINNEALIKSKAKPRKITHMFDAIEEEKVAEDSKTRSESSIVSRIRNFFK